MGLNRRAFIQFAVGGGIGSMFTPMLWKLTDDVSIWTQNWHWIPRVPGGAQEAVPALSKLLPSGSPILVSTVDGKPYATKGDPDNPLSFDEISDKYRSTASLALSEKQVEILIEKINLLEKIYDMNQIVTLGIPRP